MNEKYGLCIENGNLCIKTHNDADKDMLFKFVKNIDETYSIISVSSGKVIEVKNAGTEIGENIQQWDMNGNSCQKWNAITSEKTVSKGDVNLDKKFDVADVVLLQKWIIGVPDVKLANWKAADFYGDEKINVIDLSIMKEKVFG